VDTLHASGLIIKYGNKIHQRQVSYFHILNNKYIHYRWLIMLYMGINHMDLHLEEDLIYILKQISSQDTVS
jgi:hypothetical protein